MNVLTLRQVKKILLSLVFMLITQHVIADTLPPVSGRSVTLEQILPADVLARTILIQDELTLIRLELGLPQISEVAIEANNASPREVFFVQRALFNKVNKLAFDYNKTDLDPNIKVEVSNIKPYHVFLLADAALERIQSIKSTLNITEKSVEKQQDINARPSDVIIAALKSNRMLNQLLLTKNTASNVYQEMTRNINLAAQLLATFDDVERIPEAPTFERRKSITNVYKEMISVLKQATEIAQESQLKSLEFNIDFRNSAITVGDIYDLSLILEAEIEQLHSSHSSVLPAAKAYYPGIKTLAHVFQRIGLLSKQLHLLRPLVEKNPNWLQ